MNNFDDVMKYIVRIESSKTAGILLKRIDLLIKEAIQENRDTVSLKDLDRLKAEQKEIVFEAYRNIRDFLQTGKILFVNKDEQNN